MEHMGKDKCINNFSQKFRRKDATYRNRDLGIRITFYLILRKLGLKMGAELIWLGSGPVPVSCENGNTFSGSKTTKQFF
jgi:hypothetical protein